MKENMFPHFVAPIFHLGRPCFDESPDDKIQWKLESHSMTGVGNNRASRRRRCPKMTSGWEKPVATAPSHNDPIFGLR
jgi:hypothetical protein